MKEKERKGEERKKETEKNGEGKKKKMREKKMRKKVPMRESNPQPLNLQLSLPLSRCLRD